ncbi:MAG: spore coat protein H, partial [Bacteroidia bacterium]
KTGQEQFDGGIDTVLNVPNAIRFLAVEALIGHWDGYAYNQNNFYIYENPATRIIEFIPYDLDNTFGIDWVGRDWGTRDLMDWAAQRDGRPLHEKLLQNPEYKQLYVNTIHQLIEGDFSVDSIFPWFDFYKSLLTDAIQAATFYNKTFGFTHEDFLDGHDKKVADHAPCGLKPYVSTRIEEALRQLPASTVSVKAFPLQVVNIYPNPSDGSFTIEIGDDTREQSEVIMYNLFGQVVHSQKITSKYTEVSGITSGQYFVWIKSAEGIVVHKILVR